MPRLTSKEKGWLTEHHQSLLLVERAKLSIIEGELHFRRSFNSHVIEDCYKLRIEIPAGDELPKIKETGGRLDALRSRLNLKRVDLHLYTSGNFCLAAPQDLRLNYLPRPHIQTLFTNYLEPYLYSQSYFENSTPHTWPWDHLPHDTKGILVWFSENSALEGATKETAKEIKKLAGRGFVTAQGMVGRARRYEAINPRSRCLCGSRSSYLKCHPYYVKLVLPLRGL